MCDYAGIEIPEGCQGMSLRSVIERPKLPGRDFVVTELRPEPSDTTVQGRMLRTRRHKYIRFSHGGNPEMLFDLTEDPGETRNLAQDPALGDVLEEHRTLLANWITKAGDWFPLQ